MKQNKEVDVKMCPKAKPVEIEKCSTCKCIDTVQLCFIEPYHLENEDILGFCKEYCCLCNENI